MGSQDQVAAAYGGFNKIIFKIGGKFNVYPLSIKKKTLNTLSRNLLLVYTGIKRTAHDIARGYVNKLSKTNGTGAAVRTGQVPKTIAHLAPR